MLTYDEVAGVMREAALFESVLARVRSLIEDIDQARMGPRGKTPHASKLVDEGEHVLRRLSR